MLRAKPRSAAGGSDEIGLPTGKVGFSDAILG
jgi:hypothetical protein